MKKSLACLVVPLLAACASAPDSAGTGAASGVVSRLHPYRIDVRQGNMVTPEMVSQLKPGLTKDQVRFLLGTPLLNDVFHAERWDYVYRLQSGADGAVQQRHLVVHFENGRLARLGGDVVANGAAAGAPRLAPRMIEIMPRDSGTGSQAVSDGGRSDATPPVAAQ